METHIQRKSHPSIAEQHEETNAMKRVERLGPFGYGKDAKIDDGTNGSVVV